MIRKILETIADYNLWPPKPRQSTWCYCPKCKEDLCSSDSLVMDDYDRVEYVCTNCGHWSLWNFDIAPCPILMEI